MYIQAVVPFFIMTLSVVQESKAGAVHERIEWIESDGTIPASVSLREMCEFILTLGSKHVELLNSAVWEKVQKGEGVLR